MPDEGQHLAEQLKEVFGAPGYFKNIPIFIVSYNNGIYVQNMVEQLNDFDVKPIVIDNCSNMDFTLLTLAELKASGKADIIFSKKNFGHKVGFIDPVYNLLPELFGYTDPDIAFNKELPSDFIASLADLTQTYGVYKAGFALDLLEGEKIHDLTIDRFLKEPFEHSASYTVREWESQFWRKQIIHPTCEVYSAPIDTTFAIYRKSNYKGDFYDGVRVAGKFSSIHLPWFPRLDLFSDQKYADFLNEKMK